jgi:aminomethyltransferase
MTLRRSPLGDHHDERGARVTDFGGWEMPVSFDSIRTEHAAVRERAGKFDVSHMGEIEVHGHDAAELMGKLTTNDPGALAPGEGQYAAITDAEGTMLDDTVSTVVAPIGSCSSPTRVTTRRWSTGGRPTGRPGASTPPSRT